jgi:hypothetical protein
MRTRSRALVLVLAQLSAALVIVTIVAMAADGGAGSAQAIGVSDVLFFAVPISFTMVGALVALRLPANAVGWLCLTIGLAWSGEAAGYQVAVWAYDSGMRDTAEWAGVASFLWFPALALTGTHLVLRLPGGTLLSPRWRNFSRLCTAAIFIVGTLVLTTPGPVADLPGTHNPLGSAALESLGPLFMLIPIAVLGSAGSLVTRYRRSTGIERLQIRWIALAGVLVFAAVLTALVPTLLGLVSSGSAPDAVEAAFFVALTAIPASIGVAVLRYRLYDIDVVINRTLVYGALTALLAGVYLGSVLVLQLALSGITSDSNLAVAGSTLAVAAIFRPARTRIQAVVDHRFFRRRYDVTQILESFSSRLRDQVDLSALEGELRGVLAETMQPAHVSLWLREAPR